MQRNNKLFKFSVAVLAYTVLVILFGTFVRATGSGAGCGAHWPSCQGTAIPLAPMLDTMIEFTHRVTSGLSLVLVLILFVWVFKQTAKGSLLRKAAGGALFFTILEAILGAGLVLFQLVGENDSMARAVVIALHLVNTFMLLANLVLVAAWSRLGAPPRLTLPPKTGVWLGLLTLALFLLAMSGAITALGDTLFPASSLAEGFLQDTSAASHFLLELRVYHPLIAVCAAVLLVFTIRRIQKLRSGKLLNRYANSLQIIYFAQIFLGGLNVILLAPIWMQITHLLFADLMWINYVLLVSQVLTPDA